MIVRTFEGLQALTTPATTPSSYPSSSLTLYGFTQAYAEIFRTQPNVRICVEFLARNYAQIPMHTFRRVSDTDRVRLADHDVARWLGHPNPATTEYRLMESLMGDMGVYFKAALLKVRYVAADRRNGIGLVRIPPEQIRAEPQGKLLPEYFVWTDVTGRSREFPLSEIVYFNGYNPCHPFEGLSPMETLRGILAEEAAAAAYREQFWRRGARLPGVVTRPATAKRYDRTQAADWRDQWRAAYGGPSGEDTILLQEGETFHQTSANAKDSEYTVGGKLRREVCAAAYHIPQPLVGILEHATFSNIREQDKHLYKHCLGTWFEMTTQEFERQLLIESEDQDQVYLEFALDAQLAGTPEERASSMHTSIGRPWRTVNEGRALDNLPRIDDPEFDRPAPQQGGPSDATAHPDRPPDDPSPSAAGDDDDEEEEDLEARVAPILQAARLRQKARLEKLHLFERAAAFYDQRVRWTQELTADLTPILGAEAAAARAHDITEATLDRLIALEAVT